MASERRTVARPSGLRPLAAAGLLTLACACAAPAPAGREEGPSAPTTGSEFGTTHHAVVRGQVVDASGRGLPDVEVRTWRLADPQRGSLPQLGAVSDGRGTFEVTVRAFVPRPGAGDTAQVAVWLRGYHPPPSAAGARTPRVDSVLVPLVLVPRDAPPRTADIRFDFAPSR